MSLVRFLGTLFAFIVAMGISYVSGVDFDKILAIIAFTLIVDTMILRFIAYVYMKQVMNNLSGDTNDNDPSSR